MNSEMQLQLFPDGTEPSQARVQRSLQVLQRDHGSSTKALVVVDFSLYRQRKLEDQSSRSPLDQKLLAQILSRSQNF